MYMKPKIAFNTIIKDRQFHIFSNWYALARKPEQSGRRTTASIKKIFGLHKI